MSKYFVFHGDAVVQHPGEGTVRRVMAYSDSLMVCELEVAKGTPGGLHSHPHDQITYVVSGALEFSVGGEISAVHAGDTILMPGNVEHGLVRVLEDSVIVDTFSPKREDFLK